MSLLDDVSIVVTPNGYKAGTLYGVIPSSGAADMDVTRATAGTRVDENGLVNYAEVVSDTELVTNGDFLTNTSSLWIDWDNLTLPLNSSQQDGYGILDATTGTCDARQDITVEIGKTYLIEATLKEDVGGSGRLYMSDGANYSYAFGSFSATTTETTFVKYVVPTQTKIRLYAYNSGSAKAYFKNLSVKQADRDNVPRIDYTGGGCPHILAEPQRTNTVTYSQDTSQWTDSGMTYSVDYIISPDGTSNGSKAVINDTITSSNTRPMTSVAVTSGLNYVFSVFGKADEFDMINLDFSNSAFSSVSVDYNLTNGTVTSFTGSPVSQGVEDYGNGWYRCYVVATAIATTNTALIIRLDDNPTGDGTSGLYLWGAQFEEGSYSTSYIPTSGSTVTRNQDIFTRDGIGSLINSTEGVLFVEIAALNSGTGSIIISINDGSLSNSVAIYYYSNENNVAANIFSGGNNPSLIGTIPNSGTKYDFNKIALKYKSGDSALWVNGIEVFTLGDSISLTGLNKISFDYGNGSFPFYGKVKQLQVFKTALSDSELAALTS